MLQAMARAQDDRGAFLDILEVDPKNAQETMAERVHGCCVGVWHVMAYPLVGVEHCCEAALKMMCT